MNDDAGTAMATFVLLRMPWGTTYPTLNSVILTSITGNGMSTRAHLDGGRRNRRDWADSRRHPISTRNNCISPGSMTYPIGLLYVGLNERAGTPHCASTRTVHPARLVRCAPGIRTDPSQGIGMTDVAIRLAAAATLVWLGMVMAISFLDAPLKFRAEGLELPIPAAIYKGEVP